MTKFAIFPLTNAEMLAAPATQTSKLATETSWPWEMEPTNFVAAKDSNWILGKRKLSFVASLQLGTFGLLRMEADYQGAQFVLQVE